MKSTEIQSGYLLRFEKGEELVEQLTKFVDNKNVQAGWLTGLGGVLNVRLGYYHLKRKKYVFRHVKDVVELVSLVGNIASYEGEPALHLHGVVSDRNNKAHGGHIKELIVGGTLEIKLDTIDATLDRKLDDEIGLPLLDLGHD
jgi:predicted DNA-binding protein with PD1-like motif